MLHDLDQLQKDLDLSLDYPGSVGHLVERGDWGYVVQPFVVIWIKKVLAGAGLVLIEPKSQGCSPARDALKSHLPRKFK